MSAGLAQLGGRVWEVGWGLKGRAPPAVQLADTTVTVTVLLILIPDKPHNGWYQGCRVSPSP